MKGRLVIFCGIPGSGKTTVARLVADSVKDSLLIQTDDMRAMLPHPTFSGPESKFVYDACFAVAKVALKAGYFVVLDGTFMREEYREEAKTLLARYYSKAVVVWTRCSLEKALERNGARKAIVPPEKVRAMYEGFEAPIGAIEVETSRLSAESASKRVVESLYS